MKKHLAFLFLVTFVINFCMIQTAAAMREFTEQELTVIKNAQGLLYAPPTEAELRQLREMGDSAENLRLLQQLQERLGAQADEVAKRRNELMNRRADLAFGYVSPDAGQDPHEVIEKMQEEIESMQAEENRLRAAIVQIDRLFIV